MSGRNRQVSSGLMTQIAIPRPTATPTIWNGEKVAPRAVLQVLEDHAHLLRLRFDMMMRIGYNMARLDRSCYGLSLWLCASTA